MTGVLRSATTWIVAVLLGISVYSVMLAQQSAAERDLAQERVEYLTRTMAWQQEQIGVLHTALDQRDEQMQDDQEHIDASREIAEALERDDDEVAEWADRTVDSGIVGWLHTLRTAAAGGDDSTGADGADEAVAGPEPSD